VTGALSRCAVVLHVDQFRRRNAWPGAVRPVGSASDQVLAVVAEPRAMPQAGCVHLLALGASDCEALRDGWLAQPVNTLSSVAYLVAGAYVLRRGGPRLPALALAAVGVGSVLYHGPMTPGAGLAHDGSIVALAATVPLAWRRRSLRWPSGAAVVTGGAAVAVNLLTRTGAPLCRPESVLQGHAAWHILTASAIALWLARDAAPGGGPMDAPRTLPHHAPPQAVRSQP
jgi:hypothetical protein